MIERNEAAATAMPAAQEAARSITDDWETMSPKIDGLVSATLVEELTDVVKVHEKGTDVSWRVSKGGFTDGDGHLLQIATRMPSTKKRSDDLEYTLSSARVIVDGNIGHSAANVTHGHVIDNDNEMTARLPENPIGFKDMFQTIHDTSKDKAEADSRLANSEKQDRNRRLRRTGWSLAWLAGLTAVGVFGAPKVAEEVTDYYEAERIENEAEAAARAVDRAASLEQFDSVHPTIEEASPLADNEQVVVPATRQFVQVDNIPAFDFSGEPSQLEYVRSLPAPEAGKKVVYQIPVSGAQTLMAAHTGDSRLIVVAMADVAAQTITIHSIDSGIDGGEEAPEVFAGEIVLSLQTND